MVPGNPNYLLRSPDARQIPFPDILRDFNGFEPGRSWIDLRPLMELHIENAYYEKGASRRGLQGFLGTEVAQYEVNVTGRHLLSFKPMDNRPEGDVAVQHLVSSRQVRLRFHRLYFEVVFATRHNEHGSVLLGAGSADELQALAAQLEKSPAICENNSDHCTVFPEACSVSVEMRVVVNGKPRTIIWGSLLSSVVPDRPQHLELERRFQGRLWPVEINPQDSEALRLVLLPGDQVIWN